LREAAVSRGGIVVCLELAPENAGLLSRVLSVQFHPERLFARHEQHLRVFTTFIRACWQAG
jgi:gamma-glutamyl-gamma-aminobutyrate hydrolase PuuD